MGKGKFWPPGALKPLNGFWWNFEYITMSSVHPPTHANPCGAPTTWVVWANTWKNTCCGFLGIPFQKCIHVDPRNIVLDKGQISPWGGYNLPPIYPKMGGNRLFQAVSQSILGQFPPNFLHSKILERPSFFMMVPAAWSFAYNFWHLVVFVYWLLACLLECVSE